MKRRKITRRKAEEIRPPEQDILGVQMIDLNEEELQETEDTGKEKWSINGHENASYTFMAVILVPFAAALFCVLLGVLGWYQFKESESVHTISDPETPLVVQVQYKGEEDMKYISLLEDTSWMNTVFGVVSTGSAKGNLKISGISEKEKTRLNFREAAFLQSASAFLKRENISTDLIYVESEEHCSTDKAVLYRASMSGISDRKLMILFYPDYPDNFIFMLTPIETIKVEMPVETVHRQEETPAQVVQQPIIQQQTAQQPASQVQTQTPGQSSHTQNTYDASALTIKNVSKELLNYVGNQYLMQYSLYEYLYQNGYRKVTTATITDYQINGDQRCATISFFLNTGKNIVGIYDLDSGSYRYSS